VKDRIFAHTVVVGAGSSGCVIASRLSEQSDCDVLLLESGPDYADPALLPRDLANGRRNSLHKHDWGYKHRPTRDSVVFPLPRGRVVGGSSAVNTCIALRGSPYDYDEWGALGLSDWSWSKCLPAFRKLERDLDIVNQWHGNDGPWPVRRFKPDEWVPWQAAFVAGAGRLGYAACSDSNDPTQTGVGPHAMNLIDGRRISAAEAWLTPAVRARPNLRVRPHTTVQRVLFDGTRATGLEVIDADGARQIVAERVIICAGAINSPHLLMRSGVGPREQLATWGVDVVRDAPGVGARLLDHPGFAMFFRPKWGSTRPEFPLIQTVLRYQSDTDGAPNDMIIQPGSRVPFPFMEFPFCSIMAVVGKPIGYGHIRWTSAKVDARPVVDQRFLENPVDRRRAVDALLRARDLAATPEMSGFAKHLVPWKRATRDAASIERWILKFTDSGYHPCGTVPMGADSDPSAVLDGRGRVRGTSGLWVCDASAMPTIPSSNIHLPTLMMAERFAEWLSGADAASPSPA
jgi:choline dehydrogenase